MSLEPPNNPPQLLLPERMTNAAGDVRCVGVEMEFSGLELLEIVECVQRCVGGESEQPNEYQAYLRGTSVGDIRMELDALLFRDLKLRKFFSKLPLKHFKVDWADSLERIMAGEAKRIVPFEVIFDPIPMDQLGQLEQVRLALGERGKGTAQSLFYAFGMHLNPELPQVDVPTLLRYFRAFLALYENLKVRHVIDHTRSMTPFLDPYPSDYVLQVLDEDYTPDVSGLIDDYITANPTRNRPLDLLPILAWMDARHVGERLPDEKIRARPALHYRLPNSNLDERNWSLTLEWNRWMSVEQLANDPEAFTDAVARERVRIDRTPGHWLNRLWGKLHQ